jgi:hypothetical protein
MTAFAISLGRLARLTAALMLAVLGVAVVPGSPATAIDQTKGEPGFCPDDTGVTVVIDFQQLGGTTIVRCNPTTTRGTGLDALLGAGIQVDGVQRWGLAFVCRIENRPSAVETLPIAGNDGYRERCIDTPPAAGYWSYWHAGNNCSWTYSQWGVKNRDFVPGGFEGWSFSLNATADDNPEPRIAAVRPGTAGGACDAPAEGSPTTNDPNERQPGSTADDGYAPDDEYGEDGETSDNPYDPDNPGGSAGDDDLPAPRPREETTPQAAEEPADPDANVEFTGGEDAADVRDVVKDQVDASDVAPWAATGAMLALALLALWTARRRRRARDGM